MRCNNFNKILFGTPIAWLVLLVVGLAGCAAGQGETARLTPDGNECFWASTISNWKAIDDKTLVVWAPSKRCPYRVDLNMNCNGMHFAESIGFYDRDGRVCTYGGDAVVVPGTPVQRCSIRSIRKIDQDELQRLLPSRKNSQTTPPLDDCANDTLPEPIPPQNGGVSENEIEEPVVWGGIDNVVKVRHIYMSAQPDKQALIDAKDAGVTAVIDLREPDEITWDEQGSVVALEGMTYHSIPMSQSGNSLDRQALKMITEVVNENKEGAVLIHCSTGNRAAAWLASHLATDHGQDIAEAITLSEKAGLKNEAMTKRVTNYLRDWQDTHIKHYNVTQ